MRFVLSLMVLPFIPSRRSRRKRKAWGVSPRKPVVKVIHEPTKWATDVGPEITSQRIVSPWMKSFFMVLSPAKAGSSFSWASSPWGSASLHPRLYAVACSAGFAH